MMFNFTRKKVNPRRKQLRESMASERLEKFVDLVNEGFLTAVLFVILFIALATTILSFNTSRANFGFSKSPVVLAILIIVTLVSAGAGLYVYANERRIIKNPTRAFSLVCLFTFLLFLTKIGTLNYEWVYFSTGSAVTAAIILTIAYNQRFALGMSLFYSVLACLAVDKTESLELFLTMLAGIVPCCFALHEIRTRMKLIEVSAIAAVVVFLTAFSLGTLKSLTFFSILQQAGSAALITLAVGIVMQGFLPLIEKVFGVVTSMTLLDYSDANQPLLKKLAMEAPGTYSHSLLVGTLAETAAEAINANGLLARVGAYYHDIGKINKPPYFIENQMGPTSRHDQLSPAMSQLVIVGHVKDGIEIAKEFALPAALRQFIETHHGTTLIQYFYQEALKKHNGKGGEISESEFRYPGPKPQTPEAAIVMISDTVESATRALPEISPTKIEALVHNLILKRLQDGQFDECDITLRELSKVEKALSKSLAAYHHGRIAYPDDHKEDKTVDENSSVDNQKNHEVNNVRQQ